MIYADFQSIPMPEDIGKENPNGSNKYQIHNAFVMIIN